MTKEEFIDLVQTRLIELKAALGNKLVRSGIRTTQKDLETTRDFILSHLAETQIALEMFRLDLIGIHERLDAVNQDEDTCKTG